MPGIDGLRVLEEVRKISPSTVTVMMTGYGSVDSALEAVQRGAYEYLLKPTEVADLKSAVRRSLERKRLSEIDTLYRIGRTLTHCAGSAGHRQRSHRRRPPGAGRRQRLPGEPGFIGLRPAHGPAAPRAASMPRCCRGWNAARSSPPRTLLAPLDAVGTEHGAQSYVFVPGIANGRLICVLCADNGPEPYEFHASALRFLRSLAGADRAGAIERRVVRRAAAQQPATGSRQRQAAGTRQAEIAVSQRRHPRAAHPAQHHPRLQLHARRNPGRPPLRRGEGHAARVRRRLQAPHPPGQLHARHHPDRVRQDAHELCVRRTCAAWSAA